MDAPSWLQALAERYISDPVKVVVQDLESSDLDGISEMQTRGRVGWDWDGGYWNLRLNPAAVTAWLHVCLHEIGHVVLGHVKKPTQKPSPSKGSPWDVLADYQDHLVYQVAAGDMALENAIEHMTSTGHNLVAMMAEAVKSGAEREMAANEWARVEQERYLA